MRNVGHSAPTPSYQVRAHIRWEPTCTVAACAHTFAYGLGRRAEERRERVRQQRVVQYAYRCIVELVLARRAGSPCGVPRGCWLSLRARAVEQRLWCARVANDEPLAERIRVQEIATQLLVSC